MKLYMHAGSMNHGCEAIVRSTVQMTHEKITLFSDYPEEDKYVNLDEICQLRSHGRGRSKKDPLFVACKLAEVIFRVSSLKYRYAYSNLFSGVQNGELYLSIGGDNYCYNANSYLMYINQTLCKLGARTGLWGCSIEPELLSSQALIDDMKRYSFITARESITFDALKRAGLNNVYLFPDPAFILKLTVTELPEQFEQNNVVGINVSPLMKQLDKSNGLVLENYVKLIEFVN